MNHPLSGRRFHALSGPHFTVNNTCYALAGNLGNGAVGVVRKAKRASDRELFAIKFLAPDPKYIEESSFDDVANRFRREGERGAHLDHDNLLRIYSYCENSNGRAFDA